MEKIKRIEEISRPFLSYMYSMVPYIIKEDELIRIFDTMKAWFMKF